MNDSLADSRPPYAPTGLARPARGLLRWAYTNNPFYIISADLVFLGLRMSFDPHTEVFETWALMLGLAGYTLLLATTACLLIRFGHVWDDARSLLLLVVMMFLATSVSFDDILAGDLGLGIGCYAGGLAFAIAVSEGLLRGIRLALPPWFRAPYYAILALFFLYPVALSPLLDDPGRPALQWGLFAFSPLAGAAFLTLLPAVRLGPKYVSKNGSPWRWPLYPWSLFVFLALGVCARSYYLCISLHFVRGSGSIFGPYFLVPFLFALAALLLELGLVSRRGGVSRVALAVPAGLLALAMAGHRDDALYRQFLGMFTDELGGSPLYLSLCAASAFYAVAALRHVSLATGLLTGCLASLSVVGPGTLDLNGLVAPRPGPLLAVAVLQGWLALRRRESWCGLIAAGCLVAAIAFGPASAWPGPARAAISFHAGLAAVLLLGALFDDGLGRWLRGLGAVLLTAAGLVALADEPGFLKAMPPGWLRVYPLLLAIIALGSAYLLGKRAYLTSASMNSACWLLAATWRGYCSLRHHVVGLDRIALGMAFFLLAVAISIRKAGLTPRALGWRRDEAYRSSGGS